MGSRRSSDRASQVARRTAFPLYRLSPSAYNLLMLALLTSAMPSSMAYSPSLPARATRHSLDCSSPQQRVVSMNVHASLVQ